MQAGTNYIYIIFAVVYVIYSIIKAGKKVTKNRPTVNKQPQSSPTVRPPVASPIPQNNSGDDLKKMLEDLLGGGSQEEIPERPVVVSRPHPVAEKPRPVKITSNTTRKIQQSEQPAKQKETVPAFTPHPEVVQKGNIPVFQEEESGVDFDIRQAVIYSEILKRPEY